MNTHKNFRLFMFLLMISLLISLCACSPFQASEPVIAEVSIHDAKLHEGNQYQYISDTLLTTVDGALYLSNKSGDLIVFKGNSLELVRAQSEWEERIGLLGEFAYYAKNNRDYSSYSLYQYDISTGKETLLTENLSYGFGAPTVWMDGVMYVPTPGQESYVVRNQKCTGPVQRRDEYRFGQNLCYYENGQFVYGDSTGMALKTLEIDLYGLLIPYHDGLLILSGRPGQLLAYIDPDGKWIDLLTTECESVEASLNYYEDTVYISFLRKGKEAFIDYTTYDNDKISGTYKINMKDYTTEKISDAFYEGIYLFDDTGLYATTTSGNIYHLDFNGNIIKKVLER